MRVKPSVTDDPKQADGLLPGEIALRFTDLDNRVRDAVKLSDYELRLTYQAIGAYLRTKDMFVGSVT